MDFVHKKLIHSKKMYNGCHCKNSLLNKAFITLNPPVTTLPFSDALYNTVIPDQNVFIIKAHHQLTNGISLSIFYLLLR